MKEIMIQRSKNTRSKMTAGLFSSRTEEWGNPQSVFDYLDRQFNFELDVCATPENAKCEKYFTRETDGLKQSWGGKTCWMNPPYGKNISKWMSKAYQEAKENGYTVVCLIPARTDTRWFHDYAMKANEIWFIKECLKFGDGKQSAPFPSCIVIFRPTLDTVSVSLLIKSITINKKGVL